MRERVMIVGDRLLSHSLAVALVAGGLSVQMAHDLRAEFEPHNNVTASKGRRPSKRVRADTSKYSPHQGAKEAARAAKRARQAAP